MNTIAKNPCKVVTGKKCIMSYLNVNEPKTPLGGGTPKYSVSLIIPKSDTVTVEKIKAAIQAAYDEGLAYAKDREQFGKKIIEMAPVYDMLARMKAKLDAGRALLYQCSRYVDVYKALDDIARERSLTPEEKQELKKFTRLADALTPLAKGMNSEYCNQNTYDAIQIHGGSGFMLDYPIQRYYRDARITSIYEGTTQLQVVAAIRYIMNGTYLGIIGDLMQEEVSEELRPLRQKVEAMVRLYEESVNYVKEAQNQEVQDILGRRLYEMTAETLMSILILRNATRCPELFHKSAQVYVRMAEENVIGKSAYVKQFVADELDYFRA